MLRHLQPSETIFGGSISLHYSSSFLPHLFPSSLQFLVLSWTSVECANLTTTMSEAPLLAISSVVDVGLSVVIVSVRIVIAATFFPFSHNFPILSRIGARNKNWARALLSLVYASSSCRHHRHHAFFFPHVFLFLLPSL